MVAARNVMMEIGRSTMQQNMMMQRGGMPFGGPQGMPGMGGWGKMNPQDMNKKAGPVGPPREGDRKGGPEGRPEGDRKANPSREGDRGARPEVGPEAKERIFNELNLSKDVRAKVEGIINMHQEKIKDVIAKGREANGDREKIMAEVREIQQNMVKSLKEAMGEEKFQEFMKNAPMFNRSLNPQGRDASR